MDGWMDGWTDDRMIRKTSEWIDEGMNERMNGQVSLGDLAPSLVTPSFSSTSPGGLLSFVEGAVREVCKQKSLIISQGVGLPAPVGGLNSSPQRLPGLFPGACLQRDKSGAIDPPVPLGNPSPHLKPSAAVSERLAQVTGSGPSPHCVTLWGTWALNPRTHHSPTPAAAASAASPGPTAPPAPWPLASSSAVLGGWWSWKRSPSTALHSRPRPPHQNSAPFFENWSSFSGGPGVPCPRPPLWPLKTASPPSSTPSWGAGAVLPESDPSQPPRLPDLPTQTPRAPTRTPRTSWATAGLPPRAAPAPGSSPCPEGWRCSCRP